MNTYNNKNKFKEHPNLKQYSIEDALGHGSYGKVKLASHKITNEKVAIKFVEKAKLLNVNDTRRIQTEMKIIAQLNHPNIIREIEMFEDECFSYIVMERPTKGDLFNYICSKKRLSLKEASFMFYQIVNAIDYIHKKGIVHRDLKPENILLSEDMIIKLGDFGLSSEYREGSKLKTTCGSPVYSAPEMHRGRKYDPIPVDIWGLGIILYVMICGQLPFEGESQSLLFSKIAHCDIQFPYYCDSNCKALIKKILLPNPQDRLTMECIKSSNIYITGRANFLKEFKIYNDDGSLRPEVYAYIKKKVLEALELCMIEKSKNTEQTAAFLVFYYKLLHKTDWQNYNIPIHSLTERAIVSFPIKQEKDQKDNRERNKSTKASKNKKTIIEHLLLIRNHSSIAETLSTNKYLLNSIEQKETIVVPKTAILTHSFEAKNKTKSIKLGNTCSYPKNERMKSSCSMSTIEQKANNRINNTIITNKHKKVMSHRTSNMQTYTIADYERDLRYLYKRGYKYTSLGKIIC